MNKTKNKKLNKKNIDVLLRTEGYTHGQAARITKFECSSCEALNTLVNELRTDDTSYYKSVLNSDGVIRTAIEISNPEAYGDSRVITVLFTSESKSNDLRGLLRSVPISEQTSVEKKNTHREQWRQSIKSKLHSAFCVNK